MKRTAAPGIDLIKSFEKLELTAYPDPGTGGAPWTIGWGHTGPGVVQGLTCTEAMADAWLEQDLMEAEGYVNSMVSADLTQNQFDALVSAVYNIGPSIINPATSTLARLIDRGDFFGAAMQFRRWNKAGSPLREMLGLTRRRRAEAELFITPLTAPH